MRVAVLPGDGIGPEVMDACLLVLDGLGLDIAFEKGDIGLACHGRTGEYLPEETYDLVRGCDATLFGAITTPKEKKYVSPLLMLRWELDLFANVRPAACLDPSICLRPLDLVIVRENTEGLYTRIEHVHPDKVVTERIVSEKACRRIVEYAFQYAARNGRKKVSCVHKSNVLQASDGLFQRIFYGAAVNYAFYNKIKSDDFHVDAAAMHMVKSPEIFDVIVTLNLYGDILSDEAAGLIGGLGFAPSGNIGEKHALFEPVHGSAPDIVGKGIANPIGMILSAAMMLEHFGRPELSKRIYEAVKATLARGARTPDVGGTTKTMDFAAEVAKSLKSE
ncbi:MAG: isocitrate/isopropylmalate dehydrogenase family protein [Euryarchaeota archaeon]|nr:isocitrate/isopropylmalate dehydrogenase family protein [Euryarchaeota archaeon]